jgi:hypothetical protein
MPARTLLLTLAPLFLASLAHAQAVPEGDGDEDAAPFGPVVAAPEAPISAVVVPQPVAPMIVAPAMVEPVGCATRLAPRRSVMANRWAVGLSVGSLSLAPKDSPDDDTTFGTGELALRFRVTPHLELEATAGGGRERVGDRDGDRDVAVFALAARYRFRPEAAWNWFVMAGLGGAAVTQHDATHEEVDAQAQPLAMIGAGVERRFRHLAIQAELRAVGLGEHNHDAMDASRTDAMGTVTPVTASTQARSGGAASVGVS